MPSEILVCGTVYTVDEAYVHGVFAFRDGLNWRDDNPYPDETHQNDQWACGYSNEEEARGGDVEGYVQQFNYFFKRPDGNPYVEYAPYIGISREKVFQIDGVKFAIRRHSDGFVIRNKANTSKGGIAVIPKASNEIFIKATGG